MRDFKKEETSYGWWTLLDDKTQIDLCLKYEYKFGVLLPFLLSITDIAYIWEMEFNFRWEHRYGDTDKFGRNLHKCYYKGINVGTISKLILVDNIITFYLATNFPMNKNDHPFYSSTVINDFDNAKREMQEKFLEFKELIF